MFVFVLCDGDLIFDSNRLCRGYRLTLGHRDNESIVARVRVEAREAPIVSHVRNTIACPNFLRAPHNLTALSNDCVWTV